MQKKNGVTMIALAVTIILMVILGSIAVVSITKIVDMNKMENYESGTRLLREKISTINDEVALEFNMQKTTNPNIRYYQDILFVKYPELLQATFLQNLNASNISFLNQADFQIALEHIRVSHGYATKDEVLNKRYLVIDKKETKEIFGIRDLQYDFYICIEENIAFSTKPIQKGEYKIYALEQIDTNMEFKSKGNRQDSFNKSVERPRLLTGMRPIKFNTNKTTYNTDLSKEIKFTSEDDKDWYEYKGRGSSSYNLNVTSVTGNNWANAMTNDGSMWVWIPRFEYKIKYYNSSNSIQGYSTSVGGKQVYKNSSNQIVNGSNVTTPRATVSLRFIPLSQTVPTEGYIIHPAFQNGEKTNYENGEWNKEIPGFWISKFSASQESNQVITRIIFKNDYKTTSMATMQKRIEDAFKYDRDNNSHMAKLSEIAAVEYLTRSEYGFLPTAVTSLTYEGDEKTGFSNVGQRLYTKSSNGNITGVYGVFERDIVTSAHYIDLNFDELKNIYNNSNIVSELTNRYTLSSEYITKYKINKTNSNLSLGLNKDKYGDGIYELTNHGASNIAFAKPGRPFIYKIIKPYGGFSNFSDKGTESFRGSHKVVLCP